MTNRFVYDPLNRLTNAVDAVGTTVWAYANFGAFYGALVSEDGPWSNDLISQTYANRMRSGLSIAQPVGSWNQALGYDALLRARTLTTPDGAYTYSYAGAGGLVQGLSLPGGLSITNSFDSFGQLRSTSLKDQFQNVLNYHGYDYNAAGYRTNSVRTNSYGQYVRVGYGYDSIGQLTNASGFEASGTSRLNEKFAYAYDKAGNLLSRTNGALIQTFTSDKLNQLTNITRNALLTVAGQLSAAGSNATVNGVGVAIYGDWSFASTSGVSLSSGSNTFTISIKNSQGQTNTQTTSANLPASITPLYDSNGNLTNDGLRNFEYDSMDRLTAVTVSNAWRSEFTYDGLSRMRVRQEKAWQGAWTLTNEVRYVCLGRQVLQERDGNNAPKVTYTRGLDLSGSWGGAGGIGGLLARNDASGTAFYHADGMGNITTLVNPQGQIKARYVYDPFGNVVAKSGSLADANLYRFSSKELHPNSGLYYYGFRFYEPTLQRWVNEDPLGIRGGRNVYDFVRNSPSKQIDGDGRFVLSVGFLAVDAWTLGKNIANGTASVTDGLWVGADLAAVAADVFTAGSGGEGMEAAMGPARAIRLAKALSEADKLNALAHLSKAAMEAGGQCPDKHPPHPDSDTYPHPEGRKEHPGLDLDHRYSQTAFPELADESWNHDLKPAVENRGPKAEWEKALLQYEEDLMQRTGWTRDQVRQRVTQQEWDSIANTVHPTTHPNMDSIAR